MAAAKAAAANVAGLRGHEATFDAMRASARRRDSPGRGRYWGKMGLGALRTGGPRCNM